MLVTLYCDASFCPKTYSGGWAAWLRSERGRIIRSGPTPDYCRHAYEAEIAAIYAGLYLVTRSWPEAEAVLVRSDCTAALHLMQRRREASHRGARRLATKIEGLRIAHGIKLVPRWVKGHRGGEQTDAYLNRRVDEMARTVMRYQRRSKFGV